MPTITITEDQQAAYQRGETIVVAPPPPEKEYTASLIRVGCTRQTCHTLSLKGVNKLDAIENWLARPTVASKVPCLVLIQENEGAERTSAGRYAFDTYKMSAYRVDGDGNVTPGA